MKQGERQVSPTLDGIRNDHTARYRFAAELLKGKSVIDVACGIGYGSKIMADAGVRQIKAVDIDQEAIDYGLMHYNDPKINFVRGDANSIGAVSDYDAVVSFETIEHIKNPLPVLQGYAESANHLIVSVPNELVFPYHDKIAYHFRHYTPAEFESLLNEAGWEVQEWYGQEGPESEVGQNVNGRTIIAVCKKERNPKGGTHKVFPEVQLPPKSVAIVAMGKSATTYINLCAQAGGRQKVAEETWAINSMGNVIAHDLLFQMDDLRIQEARAKEMPESNVANMLEWLKTHHKFMTSRVYPEYPGAVEFPLEHVVRRLGTTYFNSTVAYAIAYAIVVGVKKISLFGCDFSYPNAHKAEMGRGCVEYYIGIASASGIEIEVAADSTLLDADVPPDERFYGYDTEDISFEMTDKGAVLTRKDKEVIPTAKEIETRYNHEPKNA